MTKINVQYLAGLTGILLAVTACSGDDDGSDTATTDDGSDSAAADDGYGAPPGSTSEEDTEDTSDALMTTQTVDGVGTVLADGDGLALYTNEAESDGTVKCVNACLDFWPPLEGSEDSLPTVEGLDGELGVIERPDGTMQVALDGQPLYTFADDTGPGSVVGDGFEDDFEGDHFVWNVVTVD